jgi:hypothetical protein
LHRPRRRPFWAIPGHCCFRRRRRLAGTNASEEQLKPMPENFILTRLVSGEVGSHANLFPKLVGTNETARICSIRSPVLLLLASNGRTGRPGYGLVQSDGSSYRWSMPWARAIHPPANI